MRAIRAAVIVSVVLVACADAPPPVREGPASEPTGVPDVAEIVCEADGSTTVRTPRVVVQSDGVHVRILSRLDEPASINGFGFDIDQGEKTHVAGVAPGVIRTACWPFSQHGSGEEPPTSPIEVLDPDGTFVSGELDCAGMASSMIVDFMEAPLEAGPVPLDEARQRITGLQPDDGVVHRGYPEDDDPGVAVRRDGEVVATFGFVTFDGERWSIAGATICESSGIGHR
ncbi:MAG TPA: hypothetical protein VE800_00280 [Actinomycetota bacterium]|nr:hypothetical protein [Actinomycetota bacterium]